MIGSALVLVGFADVLPLTLTAAFSHCEEPPTNIATNKNRRADF
jgi:hypothetical protein